MSTRVDDLYAVVWNAARNRTRVPSQLRAAMAASLSFQDLDDNVRLSTAVSAVIDLNEKNPKVKNRLLDEIKAIQLLNAVEGSNELPDSTYLQRLNFYGLLPMWSEVKKQAL